MEREVEREVETSAGEQAMSRLGHALIAPLLLALSLGALASGSTPMSFATPSGRPALRSWPAPCAAPSVRTRTWWSPTPHRPDLRLEVYRWVDEGQSDEQVIARMTERFGDFVRYDPSSAARCCCGAAPPSCCCWRSIACAGACIAGNRRGCRLLATEPRGARPRPQGRAEPADHGRAAGGACPHSRLYRELELARLANATPTAEQTLRDRLAKDRTAHPQLRLRTWILLGACCWR